MEKLFMPGEGMLALRIEVRPFVVLKATLEGKHTRGFQVKNIGNGTAINVRVGEVLLKLSEQTSTNLYFPGSVPTLAKGECARVRYKLSDSSQEIETTEDPDAFVQQLLPYGSRSAQRLAPPPISRSEITIEFENVERQRYFVKEKLVYGELEILDSGKL